LTKIKSVRRCEVAGAPATKSRGAAVKDGSKGVDHKNEEGNAMYWNGEARPRADGRVFVRNWESKSARAGGDGIGGGERQVNNTL
jgi:hypothetical protein